MFTGTSILSARMGTFIHPGPPSAAKVFRRHMLPAPETVRSVFVDGCLNEVLSVEKADESVSGGMRSAYLSYRLTLTLCTVCTTIES